MRAGLITLCNVVPSRFFALPWSRTVVCKKSTLPCKIVTPPHFVWYYRHVKDPVEPLGTLSGTGRGTMKDKDSKDKLSELRRRAELGAVDKSWVSDVSALSPEKVQQLIHELQVHQVELEMQNEELRRTQEDLETSRHKYMELYEFAPLGYFVSDQKGVILEANLTGSAILETARGFLIGKPLASFFNEEDGDALYFHFRQVLETQSRQSCDIRLTKKDGSQAPLRLESITLTGQDGSPTVFRTLVTDITKRKRAEEALYASESRYRRLFESARDGILIVDFDTGKILDVNQYLIDMLGYSHEQFLDKYLWEVNPFKDTALNKDAFEELLQKGYIRYADLSLETSDGRSIDVEVVSNSHLVCGVTFIQCNIRDITDRKRAAETIRGNLEFLTAVMESLPHPFYVINANDYTIVMANSASNLDLSSRESTCYALTHHRSESCNGSEHPCHLEEVKKTRRSVVREHMHYDTDGNVRNVEVHAHPILDAQGNVAQVIEYCIDITERKQGEEALKESEQRYRQLAENTLDVIWQTDLDLRFTYVNPAIAQMTGYTLDGWIGTRLPEHCDEENFMKMAQKVSEEISKGADSSGTIFEAVMLKKNKEPFSVEIHGKVIWGENGLPIALQGVTRDITARKKAEKDLHESQERLQIVLDSIPSAVFWKDRNSVYLGGNRTWLKLVGLTSSKEVVGKTDHDLPWEKEQADLFRESDRRVMESGIIEYDIVESYRRADGTQGWAKTNKVPLRDFQGNTIGILGTYEDITERKQTEEDLKERDKQYRTLFEESIDGVYSVLRDGEITDANTSCCELFGYTREEMIGKDIRELYFDPADRLRFQEEIEKSRFVKDYEVKWRKKDGTELDCLLTSSVHFGKDGSIAGYRGILRDLTAHNALQKQLLQAQKMEAVGTLAGGIAHDFNNLLQVVLGYSELVLAEEEMPDQFRGDLERVLLAGRSGADLVQRLLTFSRKTETKPLNLDLNQRILQTHKFLQRTIPKMIDLDLILADDLAYIHADPTQVDQVLMNLAVNARDAMPEGGNLVIKTANVFLDEECGEALLGVKPGEYVLLSLSDTGHGMDKETVAHIFEPFYTTKEAGKGTGLGLAMVYGIVKQHGGYIICYSEPGEGTTFKIYFPVIEMEIDQDVTTSGPMPAFGTETVLLVDDEEFLQDLGKRILERSGYTVLIAANGKEALNLYRRERGKISLVILDLIMPEMGGKQCLEELLRIDPKARVLIASGFAANGQTKEAIEKGARGFVDKPYNVKRMLQAVRGVLDSE
jgi:two-component system, cell cycle sensor histidine kinase and response regulator CckA